MTEMMPNRPPLRDVIAEACASRPNGVDLKPDAINAVILAFRDWLFPKDNVPEDEFEFTRVHDGDLEWQHKERLCYLLTAECLPTKESRS